MKRLKFIFIMFLILSLTSCKSASYNMESDINKGYAVSGISNKHNVEKLDELLFKVEQDESSDLTIVQLTKEGDPIYFSLSYSGDSIMYKYDNSKDKYGKSDITEEKVNKSDFYKNENKYYIKTSEGEIVLFDLE
ncbi:hypothetical protein D3C81_846340 [compost metagenome]